MNYSQRKVSSFHQINSVLAPTSTRTVVYESQGEVAQGTHERQQSDVALKQMK